MDSKSNYPEELRELGAAGILMMSLKYLIVKEKDKKKLARLIANRASKNQQGGAQVNDNGHLQAVLLPPWNPPEIPHVAGLDGLIGRCSKPFEKQLTESDVRDDQSRLAINKDYVNEFLRPLLNDDQDENLVKGISVAVYDLEGNEFPMVFKLWSAKVHVLTGGWKRFYHQHGLHPLEDFVTIWMFRLVGSGKLCFAVTSRRLPIHKAIKRRLETNGIRTQQKYGSLKKIKNL